MIGGSLDNDIVGTVVYVNHIHIGIALNLDAHDTVDPGDDDIVDA